MVGGLEQWSWQAMLCQDLGAVVLVWRSGAPPFSTLVGQSGYNYTISMTIRNRDTIAALIER